jgi:hypothetical protein
MGTTPHELRTLADDLEHYRRLVNTMKFFKGIEDGEYDNDISRPRDPGARIFLEFKKRNEIECRYHFQVPWEEILPMLQEREECLRASLEERGIDLSEES